MFDLPPNFHVYDTETTGRNPRFDQVMQYAALVTDDDFNIIDEIDIESRLRSFTIPSPGAMAVTGKRPEDYALAPYNYYEFSHQVLDFMTRYGAIKYIGQNLIKYDEEIVRQMMWENLHYPYVTTTKGSMRSDILPMLRMAHTYDPGIVKVVVNDSGNFSFKLDQIATLNGFDDHNAHDALGDCRATVFMMKLLRDRAPQIWNRMLQNSISDSAIALLEDNPVVHFMTYFGKPVVKPVARLAAAPHNKKQVAVWDLAQDPEPYLGMSADDLLEVFGKEPWPIQEVRTNAMPSIFLPEEEGFPDLTVEVSEAQIQRNLQKIQENGEFIDNITMALAKRGQFPKSELIEENIYNLGFPSRHDSDIMSRFHKETNWAERAKLVNLFEGRPYMQLAMRLIYTHAPEIMPSGIRQAFDRRIYGLDRLLSEEDKPFTTIKAALKEAEALEDGEEKQNITSWLLKFKEEALEKSAA